MNRMTTTATDTFDSRMLFARRLLFGLALLALALAALPAQRAAAGGSGPSISAYYAFDPSSGESVTVTGDGFTPGGTVEVWVHNESSDQWTYLSTTASAAAYAPVCAGDYCWIREYPGGRINVTTSISCPRYITIYARDTSTGAKAITRIYDSSCPY